jgi:alpha-L-fucosidase
VNSRIGNGLGDYVTLGDQEIPLTAPEGLWETIDTHNDTWAFACNDLNWKSPRELISRLVRLVSLGGNYMLNVGPTGRGVIPEDSAAILREVGAWLRRNGESIYGAGRSPIGLQAWGCSTMSRDKLFLHVLQWPRSGELWVPGIGNHTRGACFLATGETLTFERIGEYLRLNVPAQSPDDPVTVIELTLDCEPAPVAPCAYLYAELVNELGAPFAKLTGCQLDKRSWMEKFGDWHHTDVIAGFASGSEARWFVTALRPGRYRVCADYECWAEADYSEFEMEVAGRRWSFPLIYTGGGQGLRTRIRRVSLACLDIPAGDVELTIRACEVKDVAGIVLQKIVLEPIIEAGQAVRSQMEC